MTVDVADGVEFVTWQGTGCTTGTVSMTGARTCTAVFQAIPVSCDPDGSLQADCRAQAGLWDEESCSCQYNWLDPLVITLDGAPIHLTSAGNGVPFDVDGDGEFERIAWTRAGSRAGMLVLDLDGDGAITTGAELLGMPAWAPRRAKPLAGDNSFTLLAAYDTPAQGGKGDGVISAADAVFSRLRLWVDANHDGISQADELVPLPAAGVVSIELAYRVTGRRDGLGNFYRYRGRVHLQSGRTVPIWDVLLRTGGAASPTSCSRPQAVPSGSLSESASDATEPIAVDAPSVGGVASRTADIDPPPVSERVEYYHLDMLGSVRAVTDAQGHVVAHHDFLPFGEEWFGAAGGPGGNPVDTRLFTGKERDAELDLDYFGARYYRSSIGRFTSPDELKGGVVEALTGPEIQQPGPLLYADITNPQSLNGYAYVANNPLRCTDPDGHEIKYLAGIQAPTDKATLAILASVDEQNGTRDVIVSSGLRSPESNRAAGGAKDSYHLRGMAADIEVPGQTPEETAAQAVKAGAGGVGTYDKSAGTPRVHVDVRSYEWNGHNGQTLKDRPLWRTSPDKVLNPAAKVPPPPLSRVGDSPGNAAKDKKKDTQ